MLNISKEDFKTFIKSGDVKEVRINKNSSQLFATEFFDWFDPVAVKAEIEKNNKLGTMLGAGVFIDDTVAKGQMKLVR